MVAGPQPRLAFEGLDFFEKHRRPKTAHGGVEGLAGGGQPSDQMEALKMPLSGAQDRHRAGAFGERPVEVAAQTVDRAIGHGEDQVVEQDQIAVTDQAGDIGEGQLAGRPGEEHQFFQFAAADRAVAAKRGQQILTGGRFEGDAGGLDHLADQLVEVAGLVAIAGDDRALIMALAQLAQTGPCLQGAALDHQQGVAGRRQGGGHRWGQAIAALAQPHHPAPPDQGLRAHFVGQPRGIGFDGVGRQLGHAEGIVDIVNDGRHRPPAKFAHPAVVGTMD